MIHCSGALIYSLKTERFLFLLRNGNKNDWGLVGGGVEDGETSWEGLQREIREEIGEREIIKTLPLETFVSNDGGFNYHTYMCLIEEEFVPILNDEHVGYAWVDWDKWPKPLHRGLRNTLQSRINKTKIETVMSLAGTILV
jgi:8-oxo-dGTP pyrophosphatase MutT (NUDIX family)